MSSVRAPSAVLRARSVIPREGKARRLRAARCLFVLVACTGIDPNRDFPYDQDPSRCMATVTARSLNEVYRARLLQLVITFHGGMQAIGYNWGSFNYYTGKPHRSPDDVSQREIAHQVHCSCQHERRAARLAPKALPSPPVSCVRGCRCGR